MPYVNIKITDDGVTPDQKAELIRRVTDALVDVLDRKPEQTHIVIDEVPTDNWGFAGVPTTVYRARSSRGNEPRA
ncbi:MAG: 4-oxalocrotonate tautomerase family protein [Phycisphaerales bacterium]